MSLYHTLSTHVLWVWCRVKLTPRVPIWSADISTRRFPVLYKYFVFVRSGTSTTFTKKVFQNFWKVEKWNCVVLCSYRRQFLHELMDMLMHFGCSCKYVCWLSPASAVPITGQPGASSRQCCLQHLLSSTKLSCVFPEWWITGCFGRFYWINSPADSACSWWVERVEVCWAMGLVIEVSLNSFTFYMCRPSVMSQFMEVWFSAFCGAAGYIWWSSYWCKEGPQWCIFVGQYTTGRWKWESYDWTPIVRGTVLVIQLSYMSRWSQWFFFQLD